MNTSTLQSVLEVSQGGSPVALHAFGRLFGLGAAERSTLFGGDGVPRWACVAVGVMGGALLGVYAHRRWPRQVGKVIGG